MDRKHTRGSAGRNTRCSSGELWVLLPVVIPIEGFSPSGGALRYLTFAMGLDTVILIGFENDRPEHCPAPRKQQCNNR